MAVTEYTWNPLTDSVIEETDGAGNVLVEYTNEPGPYGPLISERRGSESRLYHFDALGSTRALTDDSQAVTDTFAYDAWGNTVHRIGISTTLVQWVGQPGYQTQSSTPRITHSARHRIYSAVRSRWLSIDPLFTNISLQTYSGNSPVTWIDPSGLLCGVCDKDGDLSECSKIKERVTQGVILSGPLPLQPPVRGTWYARIDGDAVGVLESCKICCPNDTYPRPGWKRFFIEGRLNIQAGVVISVGGVLSKRVPFLEDPIKAWAFAIARVNLTGRIVLNADAEFSPCSGKPCSLKVCGSTEETIAKIEAGAYVGFTLPWREWAAHAVLRGHVTVTPMKVCIDFPKCEFPGTIGVVEKPQLKDIQLELEACRNRFFGNGQRCVVWNLLDSSD